MKKITFTCTEHKGDKQLLSLVEEAVHEYVKDKIKSSGKGDPRRRKVDVKPFVENKPRPNTV
jgi:hypothetical protein